MQDNCAVQDTIEPCCVCGSVEFNLNCQHCREILLISGKPLNERGMDGERAAGAD